MAKLATRYLGLELGCPLVASSSPLTRDVDKIRDLEDRGIGGVVLPSLFEEQFVPSRDSGGGPPWEALRSKNFPLEPGEFHINPSSYLDLIRRAKDAVEVPVIASLNVAARGRWTQYARYIEQAGADALELDLYKIPADPSIDSAAIEAVYCDIVRDVKNSVSIPIAVKVSPYFTALAAAVHGLDAAGADGLVLFNRFYQPTIDVDNREIVTSLELSTPSEGRLPMVWIAILKGQVGADMAATTGVHSGMDAVRMIMAGADVAMLCSVLLRDGVERLDEIRRELEEWLDRHDHDSVDDIRGVMSRSHLHGADEFVRAGYARVLNRYW